MWLVIEYEISTLTWIRFPICGLTCRTVNLRISNNTKIHICVLAFKKSELASNTFYLFDYTTNIVCKNFQKRRQKLENHLSHSMIQTLLKRIEVVTKPALTFWRAQVLDGWIWAMKNELNLISKLKQVS
jgi:hypothetical protein